MDKLVTRQTATGSAFGTAVSTILLTVGNKALAAFGAAPFDTTDTGLLIASGGVVIGGLIGWLRSDR